MQPLVIVDGYSFPDPISYNATTSTMVSDGRNAQGYYIGSVIRASVAKIDISWGVLTVEQWAGILGKFNSPGKFVNSVTFLNQVTGNYETHRMYVSDRSAGVVQRDNLGNVIGWKGCKLSLIEV